MQFHAVTFSSPSQKLGDACAPEVHKKEIPMSKMPLALTLLTGVMTAALAQAQTPANAPTNMNAATFSYSVDTTKIGDLLDKPALRAIFEKYLPDVADSPNIEMGRDRTLPDIVQYAPQVTPDK